MDGLPPEVGFPLCKTGEVHGRTGSLRGWGNAIVPAVAAEFIRTVMEYQP